MIGRGAVPTVLHGKSLADRRAETRARVRLFRERQSMEALEAARLRDAGARADARAAMDAKAREAARLQNSQARADARAAMNAEELEAARLQNSQARAAIRARKRKAAGEASSAPPGKRSRADADDGDGDFEDGMVEDGDDSDDEDDLAGEGEGDSDVEMGGAILLLRCRRSLCHRPLPLRQATGYWGSPLLGWMSRSCENRYEIK